jgi:hypothetical protein
VLRCTGRQHSCWSGACRLAGADVVLLECCRGS